MPFPHIRVKVAFTPESSLRVPTLSIGWGVSFLLLGLYSLTMEEGGTLPYNSDLTAFCSSGCDRHDFLVSWLSRRELPFSVVPLYENTHIVIRPTGRPRREEYIKTFIAHYDRVGESGGANDNSAAVFQLLDLALALRHEASNTQIVLTDKEELLEGESFCEQGAYQLADLLTHGKPSSLLFYVFDLTGVGDTVVLNRPEEILIPILPPFRRTRLLREMRYIQSYLSSLLLSLDHYEEIRSPLLLSDNLGLLFHAFPAFQFSLLPLAEAKATRRVFQSTFSNANLSPEKILKRHAAHLHDWLPPTWKNRHDACDSVASLEPSSFLLMDRFLKELAFLAIPPWLPTPSPTFYRQRISVQRHRRIASQKRWGAP